MLICKQKMPNTTKWNQVSFFQTQSSRECMFVYIFHRSMVDICGRRKKRIVRVRTWHGACHHKLCAQKKDEMLVFSVIVVVGMKPIVIRTYTWKKKCCAIVTSIAALNTMHAYCNVIDTIISIASLYIDRCVIVKSIIRLNIFFFNVSIEVLDMRCIACKWANASMVCYLVVLQLIIQRHESFYTIRNHPCRVFVHSKPQMPKKQHAVACVAAISICIAHTSLVEFFRDRLGLCRKRESWICLELVAFKKKKKDGVHVGQNRRRRRNKITRTAQWKHKTKDATFFLIDAIWQA